MTLQRMVSVIIYHFFRMPTCHLLQKTSKEEKEGEGEKERGEKKVREENKSQSGMLCSPPEESAETLNPN